MQPRHRTVIGYAGILLAAAGFGLAPSSSRPQPNNVISIAAVCRSVPTTPIADLATRTAQSLSSAEECGLKPRDIFKECDLCPEMVVVPAGSFQMGLPEGEPEQVDLGSYLDRWRTHAIRELPRHEARLAAPFAVGRFAVTFAEWDACAADGGCAGYVPSDSGWGRGRQPAINVSWNDAQAYVAWLSRRARHTYRLPSEAEPEDSTR